MEKQIKYKDLSNWLKLAVIISWALGTVWMLSWLVLIIA